MSDKQLTGTITLPGVDPELYELTGEFRYPECGEWYVSHYSRSEIGQPLRCYKAVTENETGGPRHILRRKPRKIRVTPTQADLDAATEPIPCWFKYRSGSGEWYEGHLRTIDKFVVNDQKPYSDDRGCWHTYCEIEKEVTE